MPATYDDIVNAPEHLCAEILAGALVLTRRGLLPQARAYSSLLRQVGDGLDRACAERDWIILPRPELHFSTEGLEVLVPEFAGWTRARLPAPPESWALTPRPDWVCEITPSGAKPGDLMLKMKIYAREGVRHLWLVHLERRTLETFEIVEGRWSETRGTVPFPATQIELAKLWKW
jgi:Uma2 family endonuclease